MPSSDPVTIPKVLQLVSALEPQSILDIGCGNGRYGLLFREALDWNWGRLAVEDWETLIEGIDIEGSYLTPIHEYVYDKMFTMDWMDFEELPNLRYDLIFMGDVLEHFPENLWRKALEKALRISKVTIVVSPNWEGSIGQGVWHGFQHERHRVVLSPQRIGGRCLFATSKTFICAFDNSGQGLLEGKDVLL